ncbi:MAG: DUF4118 domain-containing protein [Rubrivivax sp.]|nr:MAG: DUF4118 domain-containing protein [Rubrivivax sp.]
MALWLPDGAAGHRRHLRLPVLALQAHRLALSMALLARPDPDELLARVQAEEAQARRGRLKIFFGASAGVGKTCAMLEAAHEQRAQGVDVVIGVVETHGRADTEQRVGPLERLPLKPLVHGGRSLPEFALDDALARRPALILMDELAHTNVAGSRHPKRWQDVQELLDAGIDVYATVNVQHLESLNDIVGGITGIRVWETVPDRVFEQADEVVLVDLPPDELLQRLQQGKVYVADQAERAVRNFFRKGNLIALREMALRRTADRVDTQMLQYRRDRFVSSVWQTRESVLACIQRADEADTVVRTAARYANRLNAPWHVIHVEAPGRAAASPADRHRILQALKQAQALGAQADTMADTDAVMATERYARRHNLGKVVVGGGQGSGRGLRWWQRSFADRLAAAAPDLDVIQVARGHGAMAPAAGSAALPGAPSSSLTPPEQAHPWRAYAWAVAACAGATLMAAPLHGVFDQVNIVMLFLLAVVLVALRGGRGPAVLASFLSVAIFDFVYVEPRLSFVVGDLQYLLTFGVMLTVALVTGQLTAGLKVQADIALQRERRVRALYEMSRDLSGALLPEQIVEIGDRFLEAEFGARASLMLVDAQDQLMAPFASNREAPPVDAAIAQWAFRHGEAAGLGTDTLPSSAVLYLPLKAPMRIRGVLALQPADAQRLLVPEQRRLLDTFASLIAIALERVHYVEVAQATTVQMESEQLRNAVLAAVSHDLRTPLAVLVALVDSLALTPPALSAAQAGIAQALRDKAARMAALVENLLDMARLQSGKVVLNRQWQPLEEVVGTAVQATREALAAHPLHTALPHELPLVQIDSVLIERVLVNLLENAAKYTPAGTPIHLGAQAGPERLDVWVEDEGAGLPPGREDALFDKFERGDKEGTTPGVGLGLALCRAIVEAHGGRIHAERAARGGARLMFWLPLGTPPPLPPEEEPAP